MLATDNSVNYQQELLNIQYVHHHLQSSIATDIMVYEISPN